MRCICVAYYARVQNNPPICSRSQAHVELCEVGDRSRRPVPRLARRDPRELLEGGRGVQPLYARHARRDAGLRGPGAPDGAGSHGSLVRLRAEAAQAAEELRREVAEHQHAGRREVIESSAAAAAFIPPRGRRRVFRGLTRPQVPYRANGSARFFFTRRDSFETAWLTTRRITIRR